MAEYIEREAAIEAVTVWYKKACRPENMSSYNMGERAAYTTAISEIAKLHAADVRPVVRGKWKVYNKTYVCSACGRPVSFWQSNYCPNCGADMREES